MKLSLLVLGVLFSVTAFAEDCHEKFAHTVCIKTVDSQCMPDTEALYYPKFQMVYDQLPPKLQAGLCSKKMIKMDERQYNSAWAWFAFRGAIARTDLSLDQWATWKDQLSFGTDNNNDFPVRDDLPKVHTTLPPEYRALYFLVIHEFGHALEGDDNDFEAWKAIDARPENTFPNKDKICIYDCREDPLPASELPALYRDLMEKSLYLSNYGAGKGLGEDIADTFAYLVVNEQHPDAQYWIELPNGDRYEVMSKLNSDRFKEKRALVKKWYDQTTFAYGSGEMTISLPANE